MSQTKKSTLSSENANIFNRHTSCDGVIWPCEKKALC